MAKLHPPVISGTIPAFSGTSIEVPFSMNRAVSANEISGLVLKLKKVSGSAIGTATTSVCESPAIFSFPTENFNLTQGEYYKVQLAYINKFTGEIGYYSTVGVVKYTSTPIVFIEGLDTTNYNSHNYVYTGVYRQASYDSQTDGYDARDYDTSEKLYSSRFYIYDEEDKIIQDSGEILHNTNEDVLPYEASDVFEYNEEFDTNKTYRIQYQITTSNGLKVSSPMYKLTTRKLCPLTLNARLVAKNEFETGTIKVSLAQTDSSLVSGSFLLSRASSYEPNKWEPIKEFTLQSEFPTRELVTDYTVEQGITYQYSIQQFNKYGVYSERLLSNEVIADFEDLFLYDGKRQLAVRFNPKVATFKQNRVEQKTETIGSKYPYIIKNGAVDYKELSISGLISYQMDAMEKFMTKDELELPFNQFDNTRYPMHDLITDNLRAERIFKTEVLKWLSNGEIKLYRSPAEGNFIVRLMNVTTSPNDTLGRMLHTFNCNAYEIAPFSYDVLESFGIISTENETTQTMKWKTVDLKKAYQSFAMDLEQECIKAISKLDPKVFFNEEEYNYAVQSLIQYYTSLKSSKHLQLNLITTNGVITSIPFYSFNIEGLDPGSCFYIGESVEKYDTIYVGVTGSYQFTSETPIQYLALPSAHILNNTVQDPVYEGFCTFGYKNWVKSDFDLISNIQTISRAGQQFIGNAYRVYGTDNIIDNLENVKDSGVKVKYIKLYPREIKSIYYDGINKFYLIEKDEAHGGIGYTDVSILNEIDRTALYKVYLVRDKYFNLNNEDYYLDKSYKETPAYLTNEMFTYFDPMIILEKNTIEINQALITAKEDKDLFEVSINEDTTNMFEVFSRTYRGLEDITYLTIGPGVIMEIGYDFQRITYSIEREDPTLYQLSQELEQQRTLYLNERKVWDRNNSTVVDREYKKYKTLYRNYIARLNIKVEEYQGKSDLNE